MDFLMGSCSPHLVWLPLASTKYPRVTCHPAAQFQATVLRLGTCRPKFQHTFPGVHRRVRRDGTRQESPAKQGGKIRRGTGISRRSRRGWSSGLTMESSVVLSLWYRSILHIGKHQPMSQAKAGSGPTILRRSPPEIHFSRHPMHVF